MTETGTLGLGEERIMCRYPNKKDVGYLRVRFEYFWSRFAHEADQGGPKVDQDATRRAASPGLFTFSLELPSPEKKMKIPLRKLKKC
jgi:hypothetical protein